MPMAVANFVGLAEGTVANDAFASGTPYYVGSVFHSGCAPPCHPGGGVEVDH